MRSVATALLLVGLMALSATAQFRTQPTSGSTSEYLRNHEQGLGLNGVKGLLDPSRMHMSHSVSMGYVNGGGTSMSRGLYMNRIDYQISNPLTLTTHLGYQFQPSGPAEWNPARTGNDFVGAADLTWRPSNNSLFRLSVAKGMSPYYGGLGYSGYGYGNGYGYEPWMFPGRP
ncbi:MAG: TonB-dependent receptor [bacterium]|nr:TonB-dependent receptor [bacterium]